MLNFKIFKKLTVIIALFTTQYVSADISFAIPISSFLSSDRNLPESDRLIALCNECTDFQLQTEALKAAATGGKVHIVDSKTGNVKAYRVNRDKSTVTISKVNINERVKSASDAAINAVQIINSIVMNNVAFDMIKPYIADSQINTAYQMEVNSHLRHQVAKNLYQMLKEKALANITPGSLSEELVYVKTAPVQRSFEIIRVIPVLFPDGTSYEFELKGIRNIDENSYTGFEPRIGSGKDGTLRIPAKLDYFGYQGNGPADSIERTVNWMRFKGIDVTAQSGGTSVICSLSETPLTCEVQK